jgi:hypothetical protein
LPLYDTPFEALLLDVPSFIYLTFLGIPILTFRSFPSSTVNVLFKDFIKTHYPNYYLIFIDGSVSILSAGYYFYIPSVSMKFSNNVPLSAFSFTTVCLAIIEALYSIKSLSNRNFIILSDSQACLMILNSSPFQTAIFHLVFLIRTILLILISDSFNHFFLWVLGHAGILVNEMADLATSCSNFISSPIKIPYSDFSPALKAFE